MRSASFRFNLLPILVLGGAVLWGAVECLAMLWSRLEGSGKAHSR